MPNLEIFMDFLLGFMILILLGCFWAVKWRCDVLSERISTHSRCFELIEKYIRADRTQREGGE